MSVCIVHYVITDNFVNLNFVILKLITINLHRVLKGKNTNCKFRVSVNSVLVVPTFHDFKQQIMKYMMSFS
jgi:hypothetical protein